MKDFDQVHHFDSEAFEQYEKKLYQKIQGLIIEIEPQLDKEGQIKLTELALTYIEVIRLISVNSYAQGLKSKLE